MKKKQNILMLIALFGLIAITAGVTFAFFSYAKQGTTDNTLTTGTITFLYTEVSGVGRGISIDDAYPISDTQGKAQTGEGKVFDFKITSDNSLDATIPYEVTARKKSDSTLDEDAVKIYLTKVSGDTEEEVILSKYSELTQTDKVLASTHVEKTIYNGKVPSNQTETYEQNFRLRMWIDKDVNFSPLPDGTYPYNDKTFTITVNVYANAKVVTDEEIENASKAEISNITIGDTELTKVENEQYDYETSLPEGTTETTIDIETNSPDATVTVERLDSLAYSTSIKRLATKKTLDLLPGDNYFKITVISENKKVENEFTLKISVGEKEDTDLVKEGTMVNIPDGVELTDLKILGNTVDGTKLGQEGRFDLVVTGKNLLAAEDYIDSEGINFTGMSLTYDKTTGIYELNGTDTVVTQNTADKIFGTNLKVTHEDYYLSSNYVSGTIENKTPSYILFGYWPTTKDNTHVTYTQSYVSKDTYSENIHGTLNESETVKTDFYINFTSDGTNRGTFNQFKFQIQLEYGNEKTEYEIPKRKRYTINLVDNNGNMIPGLGSGDTLQKSNDVWVITKSDNTIITISNETQAVLNNISIYNGVSNMYIDDIITPSNIRVSYTTN